MYIHDRTNDSRYTRGVYTQYNYGAKTCFCDQQCNAFAGHVPLAVAPSSRLPSRLTLRCRKPTLPTRLCHPLLASTLSIYFIIFVHVSIVYHQCNYAIKKS